MSDRTIYEYLRQGGLSAAGACAVMGNMQCESAMRSDNVQDGMGYSDADYVRDVNNGTISKYSFCHDARGFGLCQWTFYTRKQELWEMTVGKGISIADEKAQCQLCINELKRDYNGLYQYLCSDNCAIDAATRRVCSEYERPAVNNYSPRIDAACRFFNEFHDVQPEEPDEPEDPDIIHPDNRRACYHLEFGDGCVRRGHKPQDSIKAWQSLLLCWGMDIGADGIDGQFGADTQKATKAWQEKAKSLGADVEVNGVVDTDDWEQIIYVPT